MKQQYASVQQTANRIPLFDQALMEQLHDGLPPVLTSIALKKPIKKITENPQKDRVLLDTPGINKLQQASIFEGLSETLLSYLLSHSVIHSIAAEEKIIDHGEKVDYLYFIIEGGVKVFRSSVEGKEAPISILKAGDTFMESVLFMDGSSPVSAYSLKRSKLLLIPADIVKQQVQKGGQLCSNILHIISRRYASAVQQVDSIVTKTPFDRLGNYFLKLLVEQGTGGLSIDLHCQKSMIASHLGMKPETFSRTLKKLNAMGVEVSFKYITLSEPEVLCGFCDKEIASNCSKAGTTKCTLTAKPKKTASL